MVLYHWNFEYQHWIVLSGRSDHYSTHWRPNWSLQWKCSSDKCNYLRIVLMVFLFKYWSIPSCILTSMQKGQLIIWMWLRFESITMTQMDSAQDMDTQSLIWSQEFIFQHCKVSTNDFLLKSDNKTYFRPHHFWKQPNTCQLPANCSTIWLWWSNNQSINEPFSWKVNDYKEVYQ